MLPDSFPLPPALPPHSQILSDLCLEDKVRGRGRRRAGEVRLKRDLIVPAADSSQKSRLAAPAQCALFVPRCSKLVVCVCLSGRWRRSRGRGMPCRILIGFSQGGGWLQGGASDNNTPSWSGGCLLLRRHRPSPSLRSSRAPSSSPRRLSSLASLAPSLPAEPLSS